MLKQSLIALSVLVGVSACQPPATNETELPAVSPTSESTPSPTPLASATPTSTPTAAPTPAPVISPSGQPTVQPTPAATPTPEPTVSPTATPSEAPTPETTLLPLLEFERFKLLAGSGEDGRAKTGEQADETPFSSGLSAIDVTPDKRIFILNGTAGVLGEVTPEIVRSTTNQGDITYRLYWDRKTGLQQNTGMVYDANRQRFYLARQSTHQILEIDMENYDVKVLAGTGAAGYNGDRDATEAQIKQPTDVTVDSKGNIYFTDTGNHLLRKITPDGKLITVAGQYIQDTRVEDEDDNPSFEPLGDTEGDGGPAREARLDRPTYLTVDQNDAIYFSSDSNTIRRIANDKIDRYIGSGQAGYNGDNFRADLVHLNKPQDLTFGPDGQLYFIDRGNLRVRRTFLEGSELRVQNLVGNGRKSRMVDSLINPLSAELDPATMEFDPDGNLIVYDVEHRRFRRLEVKK